MSAGARLLAVFVAASIVSSVALASNGLAAEVTLPPLPPIAQHRIVYESTLGARINPIGIEEQLVLGLRERLFESDSLALRDNYVSVALTPTLSPAVTRFGGQIELKPLSILSLTAGFYQVGYLGSFGTLQSYPNGKSDYSDTSLTKGKDAGKNYPAGGYEVHLKAMALGKLGPIVIRSEPNAFYTNVGLRNGDTVYYGPRLDLLMPDKGWVLTTDEDIVYLSSFGLIAGGRFSTQSTFLDEPHDSASVMRLGPLLAYTIFDHPNASFNKPTLIGICQWYLQHPYRTGQDIGQGIPFVILAFRFEGELWHAN